jgi:hypothetical protein
VTTSAGPATTVRVLTRDEWSTRRSAHEARVDSLLAAHLDRRRTGVAHPVEDFLFTYYSYRPAQLRRWHPGYGVVLEDAPTPEPSLTQRRRASVEWICRLLKATAARAPHFGCFGMHEWAMVYRQPQDEVRHSRMPLRLGPDGTAAVVDELTIRCSHFDAFRFFTAPARPLNILNPSRDTQTEYEQPGCLHANMDVYRWAYKLVPLVPSELVVDCFEFAKEIRTLDMRASPYDLTSIGLVPLAVETPEGRAEYVRAQRTFATRSAALRTRLIAYCEGALAGP